MLQLLDQEPQDAPPSSSELVYPEDLSPDDLELEPFETSSSTNELTPVTRPSLHAAYPPPLPEEPT